MPLDSAPMRRLVPLAVLLAAGLTTGLAACAPEPDAPAPPEPLALPEAPAGEPAETGAWAIQAALIDEELAGYDTTAGTWTMGDATSRFTAYRDGEALRYVREVLDQGEYGADTAAYYFDADGRLFLYRARGRRARMDPAAPGSAPTSLRLVFDETGALAESAKTVGATSTEADSADVAAVEEGVRKIREVLVGIPPAGTSPSTSPADPAGAP